MNSWSQGVFIRVYEQQSQRGVHTGVHTAVFLLFFWLIVDQGLRINVKTLDRCYNSLLL